MIDHVVCEHNIRMKEDIYKVYSAELFKIMAQSWGATVDCSYMDLITPPTEEEDISGDEIALDVIRRAGLKGSTNGLHETESDSDA